MAATGHFIPAYCTESVPVALAAIDLEYGAYTLRGRTLSPAAPRFLASLRDVAAGIGRQAAGAAHQL